MNAILCSNPSGFRINCNAFQQDAITTFAGAEYAAAYKPSIKGDPTSPRLIILGRRLLDVRDWEVITLTDYEQVKDDGHNVVCIGISGDGVVHLSWDLHGDKINYRASKPGLALDPSRSWTAEEFLPIQNDISGIELTMVTYPRFLRLIGGDLLFEFRIGKSGLGDDYLYRYSCKPGRWAPVGTLNGLYLRGIENNAYINGIDQDTYGRIHVSWTYRDYVEDRPEFLSDKVKRTATRNAGPNGPENNHDLYYIYSDDDGISWCNTLGVDLELPVTPDAYGILIYEIPKFSGIMNQEGQTTDLSGGFHVLNRQDGFYYHYYRSPIGVWSKSTILDLPAISFGDRGKLVTGKHGAVYALLPGNAGSDTFTIAKWIDKQWAKTWAEPGFFGEPCADRYLLDGVLRILQVKNDEIVALRIPVD
ncbi:uncharacterized protein V2V93DRAFT_369568 [Kockiozyma suomiensis]|uniref:uncharacterized protein n=1 Tax=Kockiozyma suomiensis TaxID=1337062 RepID=UPI00334329DB